MTEIDLIVHGASQLLTMDPRLAAVGDDDLEAARIGVIPDGALAIHGTDIVDVGSSEKILDSYRARKTIDARGCVVAPGLVDPHTHTVFAGSRHLEFGMRMRGESYLDILAAGGGIHSTVRATRDASLEDLVSLALPRLACALRFGVTTMEIKSGYGLALDAEIKILTAVKRLDREQPIRLVPTFLGAHVVPREFRDRRDEYVDLVVREMIPQIAGEKLAVACDVFLDEGAFTADEARAILVVASNHGMAPKIHAGQFTDQGGPGLLAELGGLSADHLEVVSDEDVEAMARGGIVANLLPGAAFSLRDSFPDGRRFADAGVPVALATDNNPGSSRSENLPLMASMGVARMGLDCAEAWQGITSNAALAIGMSDRVGSLVSGKKADLLLLSIPDFRAFLYHFGVNHTMAVIIGGKVIMEGTPV